MNEPVSTVEYKSGIAECKDNLDKEDDFFYYFSTIKHSQDGTARRWSLLFIPRLNSLSFVMIGVAATGDCFRLNDVEQLPVVCFLV